jgi:hypothetical protein
MSPVHWGAPVAPERRAPGVRRALKVVQINAGTVLVENEPTSLGFQQDQALKAGIAFAGELRRLACRLAGQTPRDVTFVPETAQEGEHEGVRGLSLDPSLGRQSLRRLMDIGAGLRSELSRETAARLKVDLARQDATPPALNFVQGTRTPLLWEMLYDYDEDGPASAVDWRRFWGFRVPISHWIYHNRGTPEIRLCHGLFAAVSEDLAFADREVHELVEQLRALVAGLEHVSLAAALREQVQRELLRELAGDAGRAEEWWRERQRQGGQWLCSFLRQFRPDADGWKKDALVRILREVRHELLHFACHCEANQPSAFLTRLDLMLAGECVSLDVSLLATKLHRHTGEDEPGPLVFLNACGSGQQTPSYEPPGFPDKWIRHRGALAVIATLCPVPDVFANAFAREFYKHLLVGEGGSVAGALLAARRHFMEEYHNPLGLAYVLYAVQGACVVPEGVRTQEGLAAADPVGGPRLAPGR